MGRCRLLRRCLSSLEVILSDRRSTAAAVSDFGWWQGFGSLISEEASGSDWQDFKVEGSGRTLSQQAWQHTISDRLTAPDSRLSASPFRRPGWSPSADYGWSQSPCGLSGATRTCCFPSSYQQLKHFSDAAVSEGADREQSKETEGVRITAPPSAKATSVTSWAEQETWLRRDNGDANAVETSTFEASHSSSVHGWTKGEVLNWPNGISLARLISGPVLGWMIVEGFALPALGGLVLSGASDWLDGYVARKTGVNSVLGSYLDPLADKVLIGSVALAMSFAGLLHPALVGFVLARDIALVAGGFVYRAASLQWRSSGWGEFFKINKGGAEPVRPLFISKVNTVFQLALVATALAQPALGVQDSYSAVTILSWTVVGTTTLSWFAYGRRYLLRLQTRSF